jgi:hypothetical protein
MDFEQALKTELKQIIGFNKVSPMMVKQGTKTPYLFYISSEGVFDKGLDGYLDSKEVECEINIVCDSYEQLKPLTRQVINKLIFFPNRTIGGSDIFIQDVTYEKPVELYEKEIKQYRCLIDCKFKI